MAKIFDGSVVSSQVIGGVNTWVGMTMFDGQAKIAVGLTYDGVCQQLSAIEEQEADRLCDFFSNDAIISRENKLHDQSKEG